MKIKWGHVFIVVGFVVMLYLNLVSTVEFRRELPVNQNTWCGHGPKPSYILYTGVKSGWPFQWFSIGDRERCTTVYSPDISIDCTALAVNVLLFSVYVAACFVWAGEESEDEV